MHMLLILLLFFLGGGGGGEIIIYWTARFVVYEIFATNRKSLKTCKTLSFKKPKTTTLLVVV